MFQTITAGSKQLDLRASGATPIYFKTVFHKDIITALKSMDNEETVQEYAPELAYIMNQQAAGSNMAMLNYDTFIEWLDQFEPLDLVMASKDIITVYLASAKQTATPKKKAVKPKEN